MNENRVEVAKELRSYSFFESFSEELLQLFAKMVYPHQAKSGEVILKEGDQNTKLYFLRSGSLEVTLGGELIALLQNPGEVFGEMSVISKKTVSTNVKALSDVSYFSVDSSEFDKISGPERTELLGLLYRVYSVILADRLAKTNEKARLFEVTNRELSQDRDNFKKGARGEVLLVDSDKSQRNVTKLALSSSGVHLEIAESQEQAEELMRTKKYQVIICEEKHVDILQKCFDEKLAEHLILLASNEIRQNLDLLLRMSFINNVVTRDPQDKQSLIRAILTSATKILKNDLFGMEKYLGWGADIQFRAVQGSRSRDQLKGDMESHLKGLGIRQSILDRVVTVAEELLMNAIYDAPVDLKGQALFNHMTRQSEIHLDTHQQSQLCFGCDGKLVAVSVEDPFGSLSKEIILKYLKSCYEGQAGSMNQNKGGAGRGLHQIIENSDVTIFNVKKGKRTEVICLFNLELPKDREPAPTFHYYFSE